MAKESKTPIFTGGRIVPLNVDNQTVPTMVFDDGLEKVPSDGTKVDFRVGPTVYSGVVAKSVKKEGCVTLMLRDGLTPN